MKTLNFMNGLLLRRRIQVKSFMRYLSMMVLMTVLQPSSYAEQPLPDLDEAFLEFLSLYDSADEDLIDQVIEEETGNSDAMGQGINKIEETN